MAGDGERESLRHFSPDGERSVVGNEERQNLPHFSPLAGREVWSAMKKGSACRISLPERGENTFTGS